ncbi:MAG: hypothetical protein AB7H97_17675 [Pseudobdellovibrionaceae bacterium]
MRAFILLFMSFPSFAFAQPFTGALSSAMGGTGRAGLSSSEGSFLNPASIPLIKGYDFMAHYRDGDLGPGTHKQAIGLGMVDSTEDTAFPGAAHFVRTRESGRSPTPVSGELWHGAGAVLINDQLSVGVSVYRWQHRANNFPTYTQWNGALGVLWLVDPNISLAYVFENPAQAGSEVPTALREDMRQSVGSFFRFSEVAIARFDLSRQERNNPDGRMIYMFGLESATSEFFVVRAGYRLDDMRNQRSWSGGVAFNGPRLRLDYAFERDMNQSSGALHSVDLRIPF